MLEKKAIHNLKKNQNIVIKPADKGSKIVIMDLTEANRHLQNPLHYKPLLEFLQGETKDIITPIINNLYRDKLISYKQRTYLLGPVPPRPRQFYLLPKIHKDPTSWMIPHQVPPGRPIVSDCGSKTYRIDNIDSFINPLSQKHNSYVKDTYEFIDKFIKSQYRQMRFYFLWTSILYTPI